MLSFFYLESKYRNPFHKTRESYRLGSKNETSEKHLWYLFYNLGRARKDELQTCQLYVQFNLRGKGQIQQSSLFLDEQCSCEKLGNSCWLQTLVGTDFSFCSPVAGHRVCLGETIAKMELFIMFCSLLQKFKFTVPEGVKEINTDIIFGSTMKPHPYKLCAVLR